ncbi:hypothetical protein DYGSA30_08910 [Dyella sp. GSA-30]|nr:hypothetical protein DYGSA30_08910 [Dyella sp. GSA-30]
MLNDMEALVDGLPDEEKGAHGRDLLLYAKADLEALQRAMELHVDSTGNLESFRIVPVRAGSYVLKAVTGDGNALDAVHLAHRIFMSCTASCDELPLDRRQRCIDVLRLARVEAMRSIFKDAYWAGSLILAGAGRRKYTNKERTAAKRMMRSDLYRDGDSYCRGDATDPVLSMGPHAHTFTMWIEYSSVSSVPDYQQRWPGNAISPAVSPQELTAGLGLVLIDAASSRPAYAFRAMVVAAELMAYSSGSQSYLQAKEEQAWNARERATKAVTVRHAAGNHKRQLLIRSYKENLASYKNKDDAANELSRQFGVAFSTARDYLKGI